MGKELPVASGDDFYNSPPFIDMKTLPSSRTIYSLLAAVMLVGITSPTALAMFIKPELLDIPLSRLIENLEAKVKKSPDDPKSHHHLARVHAMAFAKNLDDKAEVKLSVKGGEDSVWFGYVPAHVPYATGGGKRVADPGVRKSDAALKHLDKAILQYEKAIELKGKDVVVEKLGLAWCRSQGGDKKVAIEGFREVIEVSWEKDGKAKFGGMRSFITAEAIGYILPLLDVKSDAKEIAKLKERKKHLKSLPRPITPIAIPLRVGIGAAEMIDRDAAVAFDLDGSGDDKREWQWLRPAEAAWLVHDPTGGGDVHSGIQMFGNRTFTMFFEHGYAALATLDDDADGELRVGELDGLALWHDRDGDGKSGRDEVRPLSEWGIVGLSCESEVGDDGVRFSDGGVYFGSGEVRSSFDLVLESEGRMGE